MKKIVWIAVILLTVGPILSLSLFFYGELKNMTKETVLNNIQREVNIGSANLNEFISERQGNLSEWAESPSTAVAFEFHRPEGLSETLRFLQKQYPAYDWIIVLNSKLKRFALGDTGASKANISVIEAVAQKSVKMALDSEGLHVKTPVMVIEGNLFLVTKIQKGSASGYIVAKINPHRFTSFTEQLTQHLKQAGLRNFTVLLSSPASVNLLETPICSLPLEKAPSLAICVHIPEAAVTQQIKSLQTVVLVVVGIFIFITLTIVNYILNTIRQSFSKVTDSLSGVAKGQYQPIQLNSRFKELQEAESKYNALVTQIEQATIQLESQAKDQALLEVSLQVAHDIRSPLSVLSLIESQLTALPTEQRSLIRQATQRISDIANEIIIKNKKHQSREIEIRVDSGLNDELLLPLLDSIIVEKRLQFSASKDSMTEIKLQADLEEAQGVFVNIHAPDFQRVLSNLLNNAAEALPRNQGSITVRVLNVKDRVRISILDNGKGIPPEIVKKLGQKGFSFGKGISEANSGSGMGLYHAHKVLERFKGSLKIESRLQEGTRVEIEIPQSPFPPWFAQSISFPKGTELVICDDDQSVHSAWKHRLEALFNDLNITHLHSVEEWNQWKTAQAQKESLDKTNIVYFMDFDLNHTKTTGLDLIEREQLGYRAILITSRFDDSEVQKRCLKAHCSLLPKALIGWIPVYVDV